MSKRTATLSFTASSAASLTGNSVAAVVLPLAQLAITGDALAAGTIALACALPQVLAGVFGGVLLDRFNRRDFSVVSDIISALSVAALPLVHMIWGLSLEWFIVLGIIGAIGDIPGMTARDTLLPSVIEHDGRDLQQYMGISGAIQSLAVIVGPAVAAAAISVLGTIGALWLTAGMSFAAALMSLGIPRETGRVPRAAAEADADAGSGAVAPADAATLPDAATPADAATLPDAATPSTAPASSTLRLALKSTVEGMRILLAGNPLLRLSTITLLAIVMVLGAFQGIVLPVFYVEQGAESTLGYVVTALSAGSLVGSIAYAQLSARLKNRTWYVISLIGMAASTLLIGTLPSDVLMLAGSVALGFFSGPISALLGFLMYEIIPDERRGSTLGAQNSLMLIASPITIFAASALISTCGLAIASAALCAIWLAFTLYALTAKKMISD